MTDSAITSVVKSKGFVMGDDMIALLKAHEYFFGVSDDILGEIASIARFSTYAAGAVVQQSGKPLTSICFVLRGRLKAVRVDAHGREHLFRMFERGEQYGIMLGGLGEPLPVRIFALESSTILSLDHEASMELMFQHPFRFVGIHRAKELATAGEQATLDQIPRIKQLLARLDAGLFPLEPS